MSAFREVYFNSLYAVELEVSVLELRPNFGQRWHCATIPGISLIERTCRRNACLSFSRNLSISRDLYRCSSSSGLTRSRSRYPNRSPQQDREQASFDKAPSPAPPPLAPPPPPSTCLLRLFAVAIFKSHHSINNNNNDDDDNGSHTTIAGKL